MFQLRGVTNKVSAELFATLQKVILLFQRAISHVKKTKNCILFLHMCFLTTLREKKNIENELKSFFLHF